jgi:hypothetical protein
MNEAVGVDQKTVAAKAWAESGRRGDEYYSALTNWMVSLHTKGSASEVYSLALIYEKSRDEYLECVEGFPSSFDVQTHRDRGSYYKSLLSQDYKSLFPMITA